MIRYLAIAVIAIAVAGCKKKDYTPPNLQGKWELSSVVGPWNGQSAYLSGNGNTLVFKDNTYIRNVHFGDTSYQHSGIYRVYQGKACEAASEATLIIFDDGDMPSLLSFPGGALKIGSPLSMLLRRHRLHVPQNKLMH